ncbi:hypothetical protein WR25_06242 isoform C [Diploscapter pachys]|uniref:G-protein coupled receptors family 1 profile domain-containing protein n=1 Tax=Diploscapter pachys TaxID=2018661 RepID=A0A2A2LX46_9BILA|nr:hypothetical protein WR25_06242 isoform C [Diploscapter pachys]
MCVAEENGWRMGGCWLDLVALPIICFAGMFLNICCLIVFFLHRSHPLVPALIFLSTFDLLQLLFSIFVLFIPALHDYTLSHPYGLLGQIAYLSTGLLSPLLLAVNSASIWTICYITVQRHKAILRPLSCLHPPSRQYLPLLLISFAALAFNGSKWVEFHWYWIEIDIAEEEMLRVEMNITGNHLKWFLAHNASELALNENYRRIMDNILYPLLVYGVPLLLLSVLNFQILTHIFSRRAIFDHKKKFAQETRAVTLLISIVTTFFLCHTGGLAIRFFDHLQYEDSHSYVLITDLINLLFNINSLTNPLLYFVFTRQFRDLRVSFLHSHFASPSSRSGESMGDASQYSELRDLNTPYRTPCLSRLLTAPP